MGFVPVTVTVNVLVDGSVINAFPPQLLAPGSNVQQSFGAYGQSQSGTLVGLRTCQVFAPWVTGLRGTLVWIDGNGNTVRVDPMH